ncbi:PEP/pyruvate-binding domain-containing protein [Extensimonas perlucida]|uniref:PEP/pyruvate-binding domain-containing protein n=1 Tax=Extensimonas perlucida TaxID=2590786 RepID=UPI001FE98A51|nr:PEP/pyruvate-binding domain-containing protein [Extensimonas perlucida]
MKSTASHWPKHFYLIAQADQDSHGSHHAQHGRHARTKAGRESMGSKAWNLLRMAAIGLRVPPALVIGTHYTQAPDDCLLPAFSVGVPALEEATGLALGDPRRPLIVSVRSGAPVSMPGMMETLLNVGLCDATLPGLLRQTGNPRMVWDAYRRLVASYAEVVAGVDPALFEQEIARVAQGRDERLLDFNELRGLTRSFQAIYQQQVGEPFPQSATAQLGAAIRAVFASWHAEKAVSYRKINHIDDQMGTAVTVQQMVFGNSGGHSGAGVGFTRDPMSGQPAPWVDFLVNAQGEDVVSGRRNAHGHEALAEIAPDAWRQLQEGAQALEHEFKDMQDFEFTVQDGVLHWLQTRAGKRTPLASVRIALDLLAEGVIDEDAARERTQNVAVESLGTLQLVAQGEGGQAAQALARATPACPGVVSGEIALDGERAAARAAAGVPVVLVRQDAETADIDALGHALGLLTQRGARTSHAAVVARQLGKVCLVGCGDLHIDPASRSIQLGAKTLSEGEVISLDGNAGQIFAGAVAAVLVPDEPLQQRLQQLRKKKKPD